MRKIKWQEKNNWKKIWAKLPEILMGMVLVLVLWNVGMWLENEASFRTGLFDPFATPRILVMDVIWLGAILVMGIQKRKVEFPRWRKEKWLSGCLILGVIVLAGAIWGINPERSFWGILRLLEVGGILVMLKNLLTREKILQILEVTGAVQGGIAGMQFLSQRSLGLGILGESPFDAGMPGVGKMEILGEKVVRAMGTFPHANVLGGVLGVIFVLVLLKPKKSKWDWVCLGFLGVGVLASWSRGAILGVVLGGGWVMWNQRKKLKGWVKLGILGIGILGIGILGMRFLLGSGMAERWEGMKMGLKVIREHPLLGVGLGNFTQGMDVTGMPVWEVQPVHNLILLWGAEIGILGMGILIVILGRWMWKRVKWARVGAGAIFLTMLPGILGDHFWFDLPQGLVLGGIFLFLVNEMPRERKVHEVVRKWVKKTGKKLPVRKYSKWK